MAAFTLYEIENAPEKAKPILQAQKEKGGISNQSKIMAGAPDLLAGYVSMWDNFTKGSFTPTEQQIVYMTVSFENGCLNCMTGHSGLAKKLGVAPEVITHLREGTPLSDPKLESLRLFTQEMVNKRGKVSEETKNNFFAQGYTPEQALEVIQGIAIKTMSNYANNLAKTPLEEFLKPLEWKAPAKA